MKYIFKEYTHNYKNYKFPYTVYALSEKGENVDDIYNKGFVASRIQKDYYYLSRNLRIDLEKFSLTSENRRILRKAESLSLTNQSLKDFTFNYEITKLATEYFKKKFNEKILTTQKLKWLLSGEFFTNVLTYTINNGVIGYCIIMETEKLLHYTYPFYKAELISQNIGMAMMIKAIEYAKEQGKKYIYLGTVYTKDSLYKLQFRGLEWFDENSWNQDIEKLKEKIENE